MSARSGASAEMRDRGRVTYVGHATVLLDLAGVRLLTDPLLRRRLVHLRRHVPPPAKDVTERIDAVLVSHMHFDHLDVHSLGRLGTAVRVIGPPGSQAYLRRRNFVNATELRPGETASIGGIEVATVPAEHHGRRWLLGAGTAVGFEIRAPGWRAYFAGDTDLFPEMASLAGDLDLALLPVWGWGPDLGPGHLDPERAAEAAAVLNPRVAIPIHWGTFFPLGMARRKPELLREPPLEFAARVAEVAPGVEVRVLEPGDSLALSLRPPRRSPVSGDVPPPGRP